MRNGLETAGEKAALESRAHLLYSDARNRAFKGRRAEKFQMKRHWRFVGRIARIRVAATLFVIPGRVCRPRARCRVRAA